MIIRKLHNNKTNAGTSNSFLRLLAAVFILAVFQNASAVETGFSTTIDSTNTADTAFLIGSEIRFVLDIDAAAFDDNPDPAIGSYDFGINGWTVEIPDHGILYQFGSSFLTVYSDADQVFIGTLNNLNGATLAGTLINSVDFQLRSSDDSTFTNDDIPTSFPNSFNIIEIAFNELGSSIATLFLSPDISPLQPSISDLITELGQCVTALGLNNNFYQVLVNNWYHQRLIKALNYHQAGADGLARFQVVLFIIGIEAKRGWLIADEDADLIVDKALDLLAELY